MCVWTRTSLHHTNLDLIELDPDEVLFERSSTQPESPQQAIALVRALADIQIAEHGEPMIRNTFLIADGSLAKMVALEARFERCLHFVNRFYDILDILSRYRWLGDLPWGLRECVGRVLKRKEWIA